MSGKWLGCPYTLPEYAWGLRKHKLWLPLSAEHNELCAKNIEMLLLVPVSQNTRTPHTASECPVLESWWGWQQTWHCPCVYCDPWCPGVTTARCHAEIMYQILIELFTFAGECRLHTTRHQAHEGSIDDSVEDWGLLQQIVPLQCQCLLFCIQEFYRYNSLLVSIVCAELTQN